MDCQKVGQLIYQLRTEKKLTQWQLADMLNVSNKTVSKWETGHGAPDVTLWAALSDVLGADVMKLLQGEMTANAKDIGKLDKIRFYVCPVCGNILTSTGSANVSCCGRHLSPLAASDADDLHTVSVEEMDGEFYVESQHEMTKEHHWLFAAYVYEDQLWFRRFYPEQSASFRIPALRRNGNLYLYCTQHGLFGLKRPLMKRG